MISESRVLFTLIIQKKAMTVVGTKEMMKGVKLTQALNPRACISTLKSSLTKMVLSVKEPTVPTSLAPIDMQTIGMDRTSTPLDTLSVACIHTPDVPPASTLSEP
jgi:hypothetical protein